MNKTIWFLFIFFTIINPVFSQSIQGTIRDVNTNDPVIGAIVTVKGTSIATSTDLDGKFELNGITTVPFTLLISFVGYEQQEIEVTSLEKGITLKLKPKEVELKGVEVTGSRITEKQKESPLTVESMDIIAIKECPQTTFYEGLGTLKGVDLTSASLGFTIVNTRGFNSTSPVRSLQVIDGVDNQAPGLSFSLGNFLGAPELDVMKVDMIAGASSAYFGPNAFNGVISMTTRSPFVKPGLEVSMKAGERGLLQSSIRWAQVIRNKAGEEKFGYKLNLCAMKANDWEANNMSATPDSHDGVNNPGGYDAVNIYGDEYYATNDFSKQPKTNPGLMTYYRTGYAEKDLVDYNTENIKLGAAFHYKLKKDLEAIFASNFGTGTTVYQGDNRYSLKDILFFQNRLELRKENKYFIRAYATNEDAGNSYDAFFTALLLQRAAKKDFFWSQKYRSYWTNGSPSIFNQISNYPGFPQPPAFGIPDYSVKYQEYLASINPFLMENYYDSLVKFHDAARQYTDNSSDPNSGAYPFFEPGTQRFDSAFSAITSQETYAEGGSKFYDKSALYHIHGEYKFTPKGMDIITGANYRLYKPKSNGTIFSDTAGRKITNQEWGLYAGFEKKFMDDKLKVNLTGRIDKNENFDLLFSPAASVVYSLNQKNILRFSFSSAIRNPTLSDQYLYYNVGRAILVGNIDGYDSLVTIESLKNAFYAQPSIDSLVYFNIGPVEPEKVKTVEIGYRASLFDHLYVDMEAYYSIYNDFIGYIIGGDVTAIRAPLVGDQIDIHNIYRISSNSKDVVNSEGFSVGINYYIGKFYTASANYSWNELNKRQSDDPIIPAFNTPRNKYNLGFAGRDIEAMLFKTIKIHNWGFNINYKWVQGFLFEGSPQFTGAIDNYDLVDAQVNKFIPAIHSTFKAGASNLLNNKHYEVYGGPLIGRLAYFSILVELN